MRMTKTPTVMKGRPKMIRQPPPCPVAGIGTWPTSFVRSVSVMLGQTLHRARPAGNGGGRLFGAEEGVAPVGRGRECFLDGAGLDPAQKVHLRARLVVGARAAGPAEGLLSDHRSRGL